MFWIVIGLSALLLLAIATVISRRRHLQKFYEERSISPQGLNARMQSDAPYELYDVRLPLDVLANAVIVPGAKRIPPDEIENHPERLPRDRDIVVYCTCPSEETARRIANHARTMGYTRVWFLRGGLAAWRAAGYQVQPYNDSFELNPVA